MFGSKKTQRLTSKIEDLEDEKERLAEQVQDLKLKAKTLTQERKLEDEDLKHMVKMRKEALEQEFKGKEMDLEKAKNEAIATVKDEYRDKVEQSLTKRGDDMKEMYGQILARLPDINVKLKGDV